MILKKLKATVRRYVPARRGTINYRIVKDPESLNLDVDTWNIRATVEQQHDAYERLLQDLRAGNPRVDLRVAAQAVEATGLVNPSILEVGCGSGYYSEVLDALVEGEVRYTGLDYAYEMASLATSTFGPRFVVGDAAALPMSSDSVDIVLNGVSLMHTMRYQDAIAEAARVASKWCIFHTVPTLRKRATTLLVKDAYAGKTLEYIFNESSLISLFEAAGLTVTHNWPSIDYNLSHLLGEATDSQTLLCRKTTP